MSWLKDVVRPRLREIVSANREAVAEERKACPNCGATATREELAASLFVCRACDHHLPLAAAPWFSLLFDDGAHYPVALPDVPRDPLRFRDLKRYTDRLRDAKIVSGQDEALRVSHGSVAGTPVVAAVVCHEFLQGSVGVAVGAGLVTAARLAVVQEAALIVRIASSGLRLQEGALALVQTVRIAAAFDEVKARGLPLIAIAARPTAGTSWAALASLAHLMFSEPGAAAGLQGEAAAREVVGDEHAGRATTNERADGAGLADAVVHRHRLRSVLAQTVALLRCPRPSADVLSLSQAKVAAAKTKPEPGNDPARPQDAGGSPRH